jgi:hypothetical protein
MLLRLVCFDVVISIKTGTMHLTGRLQNCRYGRENFKRRIIITPVWFLTWHLRIPSWPFGPSSCNHEVLPEVFSRRSFVTVG